MTGKQPKTTSKDNLILLTISIILINWFLFNKFSNASTNGEFYIVVTVAVFINAFYFLYLRVDLNAQSAHKNHHKLLTTLIDGMPFAEPHNEETVELEPENTKEYEKEEDKQDTVDILKPKEIVHKEPIFDGSIEPDDYCDDLSQYMLDNGLSVDKNQIREVFACMVASKLMVFTNDDPIITERFIELFSEFIGANFLVDEITDDIQAFEDLFSEGLHFKESITTAVSEKNRLNMMALKKVNLDTLHHYFDPIIDAAINPSLPSDIRNRNFQMNVPLPSNIWFMILPEHFEQSLMTQDLVQASVMMELNANIIVPKEKVHQNALKLSYEHLTNLLTEGQEKHFLEEEDWKKIDQVESYFNQHSSFVLDNKQFRELERYASAFLMFGGDTKEALDSILFAKLLRLVQALELNKNEKDKEDILILFEKLFGLEYLSRSKPLLKAIQASN